MGKLSGVIFVLLERTSASRFSIRFRVSAPPEGYSVRILLNCFRAPAQSPARSKSSAAFKAIDHPSVAGGGGGGVTTGVGTGVGVGVKTGVGVGVRTGVGVGVGVNCLGVIGTGVGVMRRGVTTGVGFGVCVGVGVTSAMFGPWKLLIVCQTKNPPRPSTSRTTKTSARINSNPKIEILGRFGGGVVGGWSGNGGGATVAPPDDIGPAFVGPVASEAPWALGGFVE